MSPKIGKYIVGLLLIVGGVCVLAYSDPYYIPEINNNSLKDVRQKIFRGQKTLPYTHIDQIPDSLVDKIIQLEDQRFYRHMGVDIIAMVRAVYYDAIAGFIQQGASTIDQQVIKLSEQAYIRSRQQKLHEIRAGFRLNRHYDKSEILLAYLNRLEFPYGVRGVRSGCIQYFGKSCDKLSTSEEYFIIASYQLGQNGFSASGFDKIKSRSRFICELLDDDCTLIMSQSPTSHRDLIGLEDKVPQHIVNRYQNRLDQDPIKFDLGLYEQIEKIISNSFTHRQKISAEDCCVVILNSQGDLVSMNTCRPRDDPDSGKVNSCLMQRQTGSAIKPFLYIWAMKQLGIGASDTIVDDEITYQLGDGTIYSPKNFDLKYHGEVSIATALGSSLNVPAVKLLDQAGAEGFIPFLSNLRVALGHSFESIDSDADKFSLSRQGLSLALGTYEMSPISFGQIWTIFLRYLDMRDDYSEQIFDVSDILSNPQNRLLSFGQNNVLNIPGWIAKTGTSRHFVDGRACGANREIGRVVCVWMGNHNASVMRASGIDSAGYLWRLVVEELN